MFREWIRNVGSFMILQVLLRTMLPSEKYEPYVRFYTGMVMILIIGGPLLSLGGMEQLLERQVEEVQKQLESWIIDPEKLTIETWDERSAREALEKEAIKQIGGMVSQYGGSLISSDVHMTKEGVIRRMILEIHPGHQWNRAEFCQALKEHFQIPEEAVEIHEGSE